MNVKWQEIILSVGGLISFLLLYRSVELAFQYNTKEAQREPLFQIIYFMIVIGISVGINIFCKCSLDKEINYSINFKTMSKIDGLKYIIPLLLFGNSFFVLIPDIFSQSVTFILASFFNALGSAIFEETKDRGLVIRGLIVSFPDSEWKPLLVVVTSSLISSLPHYINLLLPDSPTMNAVNQQVFYTFFCGMCLAVLVLRTNSIFFSILFHFINVFTVWSPTTNVVNSKSWVCIVLIYGYIPLGYSLWCLRPKLSKEILNIDK